MIRRAASLLFALAVTFAAPAAAEIASTEEALAEKVMGSPDAPIEIIAYESLTCPHCASFHANAWPKIKETYVETGKARFVFRDFPFDALALRAGMLARCSGEERYFGVLEVLFESQDGWMRADDPMKALAGIGRLAGISQEGFDACMANEQLLDGILARRQEGEREFDVTSTPTFFINGTKVVGAQPFEKFDEILKPLAE